MRTPFAIAALASLGIHGLLFLVLPLLPSQSKVADREEEQAVNLVELTPEETQRLPQFDSPRIELPPIARQPNSKPSNSFSLDSLPPPPDPSASQPSIGSFFDPPPLQTYIPPVWTYPTFQMPTAPEPAPPKPRSTPPAERPSPTPQASASPQPSPSPQASPSPGATALLPEDTKAPKPSPSPDNTTAANRPPSPSPDANAANSQPPAQDPRTAALIAGVRAMRAMLTPDMTGLNPRNLRDSAESDKIFTAWIAELGKDLNELSAAEKLQVNAAYPQEACPIRRQFEQTPQEAYFGVVVNKDDKVIGDPKLLRSSGLQFFNAKASDVVRSYSFENKTNVDKLYVVKVTFDRGENTCRPGSSTPSPSAG